MTQRKEMVPADTPGLCGPEWRLLCKLRQQIKQLILARPKRAADFRKKLKGMLAGMDDAFSDWPEDPK